RIVVTIAYYGNKPNHAELLRIDKPIFHKLLAFVLAPAKLVDCLVLDSLVCTCLNLLAKPQVLSLFHCCAILCLPVYLHFVLY
ncbi:unnamed protein product, partial [Cylicocyclus nassatus]